MPEVFFCRRFFYLYSHEDFTPPGFICEWRVLLLCGVLLCVQSCQKKSFCQWFVMLCSRWSSYPHISWIHPLSFFFFVCILIQQCKPSSAEFCYYMYRVQSFVSCIFLFLYVSFFLIFDCFCNLTVSWFHNLLFGLGFFFSYRER